MPLKNSCSNIKKVAVYKFLVDENEKEAWIKAIPRQNLVVTKYTFV